LPYSRQSTLDSQSCWSGSTVFTASEEGLAGADELIEFSTRLKGIKQRYRRMRRREERRASVSGQSTAPCGKTHGLDSVQDEQSRQMKLCLRHEPNATQDADESSEARPHAFENKTWGGGKGHDAAPSTWHAASLTGAEATTTKVLPSSPRMLPDMLEKLAYYGQMPQCRETVLENLATLRAAGAELRDLLATISNHQSELEMFSREWFEAGASLAEYKSWYFRICSAIWMAKKLWL
jgi:hypothetical protein